MTSKARYNQGHLRLFEKYPQESKELTLKYIKLKYDPSKIMSDRCSENGTNLLILKKNCCHHVVFWLNHSTSFITHTLADIKIFSWCSTLVTLPLFHVVAFLRWANSSLRKDAFPFIRPLGIKSWSPWSYLLMSQRICVALQPEKLYCIIKINKTKTFLKKS